MKSGVQNKVVKSMATLGRVVATVVCRARIPNNLCGTRGVIYSIWPDGHNIWNWYYLAKETKRSGVRWAETMVSS